MPRGLLAHVTNSERWKEGGRFGDIRARELMAIIWKLQRGYLDDWADLCEHAITRDATLASLYVTRITRVTQADWQVRPNPFGDRHQAELAAEFCNEMLGRVENWDEAMRFILHAIAVGYSCSEMEWDHDKVKRTSFVREIHFRHPHRFRLDSQYKHRLWDDGQAVLRKRERDGSFRSMTHDSIMYGLPLDPRRWLVHLHQEITGYNTCAGVMRPAIWLWLQTRWADQFYLQAVEKFGQPFLLANVAPNAPARVRQDILDALSNLASDHAAVIESGDIKALENSMSTSPETMHSGYLDRQERKMAMLWLGASDITSPGDSGSRSAVETRAGATMDPRMVTDGTLFGGTVASSLFKWGLTFNRHRFGGSVPPIPSFAFKTAGDEVEVDRDDLAMEKRGDVESGDAIVVRGPETDDTAPQPETQPSGLPVGIEKAADEALNGAQIKSMVDIVVAVASGQLPRGSAVQIIKRAFNMDDAQADKLLDEAGRGFVQTPPDAESEPDRVAMTEPLGEPSLPKALSRSAQERRTVKPRKKTRSRSPAQTTLPISSHSAQILAAVLRGQSDDPAP